MPLHLYRYIAVVSLYIHIGLFSSSVSLFDMLRFSLLFLFCLRILCNPSTLNSALAPFHSAEKKNVWHAMAFRSRLCAHQGEQKEKKEQNQKKKKEKKRSMLVVANNDAGGGTRV
jgi:hypothetical protein